jgi:hypothetical protein
MTMRTAQCGCGRVQITVEGDPILVAACHCDFCQKRTGSAFGVQAYFAENQCLKITGDTKVYNGLEVDGVGSTSGQTPDYHFCTTCGSTLYWPVESRPGMTVIGIAVGNFVDPTFTAPMREYHTELRHPWVSAASSAEQFEKFPDQRDRYRGF